MKMKLVERQLQSHAARVNPNLLLKLFIASHWVWSWQWDDTVQDLLITTIEVRWEILPILVSVVLSRLKYQLNLD